MAYTLQLTITCTKKLEGGQEFRPPGFATEYKEQVHGNGDTVNNIKSCIQKKDIIIMKVLSAYWQDTVCCSDCRYKI